MTAPATLVHIIGSPVHRVPNVYTIQVSHLLHSSFGIYITCHIGYSWLVGGVAQWLGRWSLADGLSVACPRFTVDRRPFCG